MNERERQAMMKLFLNNEIDNVRPQWNKHGYARRTNVVWTTASTIPNPRGRSQVHLKYHGKTLKWWLHYAGKCKSDYGEELIPQEYACDICLALVMDIW